MSGKDNSVTVLIEIHAEDGREQEARDALLHAIRTSEKPGLVSSAEYGDIDDPGAFYAVQVWETADDFHAHMRDAADNGMSEAVRALRGRPRTTLLRGIG